MSKKFIYGQEIIDFLEGYGYNKRGEDFEQNRNYATVTYMYAIPKGMRPQTPYVEFTVDADNDAFIFGEFFTDGRKGYSTEFDSVEDLKYFIENANYSNVDLTESKSITTLEGNYKADDGNDYYELALNLESGEFVKIKNASCTAVAEEMACEYFGVPCNGMTYKTIKIIFLGTSPNVDINKLPKKYQKYWNKFNETKSMKESKSTRTLDYDDFLNAYEADSILNDKDELIIVLLRHGKAEVSLANKDNINVTFLNENGAIFTKYFANNTKGHVEMLAFLEERA